MSIKSGEPKFHKLALTKVTTFHDQTNHEIFPSKLNFIFRTKKRFHRRFIGTDILLTLCDSILVTVLLFYYSIKFYKRLIALLTRTLNRK